MPVIAKGLILAALVIPALTLNIGAESGRKVGEEVSAFEPYHVTGVDRGTNTCPVCKYGAEPAAQVWVNGDDTKNVATIAKTLEAAIEKNGLKKFRAFMVFLPAKGESEEATKANLSEIAKENGLSKIALTFIDANSKGAIEEYHINTAADVRNTVMVYANRTVVANYVNLKADDDGVAKLNASIGEAVEKGR